MKKRKQAPEPRPRSLPELQVVQILDRIAGVTGVTSDAALAAAMGVSPQALANWRVRGTVPYEAAVRFAAERGFSLDYVLLGRGSPHDMNGDVAVGVRDAITEGLLKRGVDEQLVLGWTAIISQRLLERTPPTINPLKLVDSELDYVLRTSIGVRERKSRRR